MTQRQKNAQKQKQKETWKYTKEEINRKIDRLERRTRHQRGHGQSIGLVACNPLHSTWHRIALMSNPLLLIFTKPTGWKSIQNIFGFQRKEILNKEVKPLYTDKHVDINKTTIKQKKTKKAEMYVRCTERLKTEKKLD